MSAVLLAGVALVAGCHSSVSDPADPKFVVAQKGNWQIFRGELDGEVLNFLKQHRATPELIGLSKMPIVETAVLKRMVLKKLILDRAAVLPLKDVDKDETAELDAARQSLPPGQDFNQKLKLAGLTLDDLKRQIHESVLVKKVLQAEVFKNLDPTDQEINDIYLRNKERFDVPEKVRASRILIHVDDNASAADKAAKKKAIEKARDRVVHGEDFGKVAAEVSEDVSSAPKGGDLDFFPRNVNEPGFDDMAFHTKENAISPVFETALGYQFLKVTAIQSAGVAPLAEVRDFISSKMREHNMEVQYQAYAGKLLADSGVTYNFVLVDPPAQEGSAGPGGPDGASPSAGSDSSAAAVPSAEAPQTLTDGKSAK